MHYPSVFVSVFVGSFLNKNHIQFNKTNNHPNTLNILFPKSIDRSVFVSVFVGVFVGVSAGFGRRADASQWGNHVIAP